MPPLIRMLSSLVLIVLALCLGVMSLLYVFQEKMVFFPGKRIVDTPETIGLQYEDVHLVTEDDVKIHGWYVPHVELSGDAYVEGMKRFLVTYLDARY